MKKMMNHKNLTENRRKSPTGFQISALCLLLLLILTCLVLELFCQDGIRSGISVNVMANEKIDTVNADVVNNIEAYLNPLNIFSYFTQLSNTLTLLWAGFYLISLLFRLPAVRSFCECGIVLVSLTAYLTVAGGAVGVTMLLGLSQFQKYKNAWSLIYNLICIVYHFVTPIFMWVFCITGLCSEKPQKRQLPALFIFPVLYAAFTFIRGLFIRPGMYPYFIFNPKNIWAIIGGGKPINYVLSYAFMMGIFALGACLFYAVGRLIIEVCTFHSQAPSDEKPDAVCHT